MSSPIDNFNGLDLNKKYLENATKHRFKIRNNFENILQTTYKNNKKRQISKRYYYYF